MILDIFITISRRLFKEVTFPPYLRVTQCLSFCLRPHALGLFVHNVRQSWHYWVFDCRVFLLRTSLELQNPLSFSVSIWDFDTPSSFLTLGESFFRSVDKLDLTFLYRRSSRCKPLCIFGKPFRYRTRHKLGPSRKALRPSYLCRTTLCLLAAPKLRRKDDIKVRPSLIILYRMVLFHYRIKS